MYAETPYVDSKCRNKICKSVTGHWQQPFVAYLNLVTKRNCNGGRNENNKWTVNGASMETSFIERYE